MILSKEDVKYISQNINPEETNYVMGVSTILNDVGNEYKSRYEDTPVEQKPSEEKINQEAMATTEDILLLNKLIGYSNKFINATYACKTEQYKYRIQDYQWRLKDTIEKSMRIMSLKYGQDFNIVYNIRSCRNPPRHKNGNFHTRPGKFLSKRRKEINQCLFSRAVNSEVRHRARARHTRNNQNREFLFTPVEDVMRKRHGGFEIYARLKQNFFLRVLFERELSIHACNVYEPRKGNLFFVRIFHKVGSVRFARQHTRAIVYFYTRVFV